MLIGRSQILVKIGFNGRKTKVVENIPPAAGKGRPKGSPNKTTQIVRDAIALLAEQNVPKMQTWLDDIAKDNPLKAYELTLALLEYNIPKLARTESSVEHSGELAIKKVEIELIKS